MTIKSRKFAKGVRLKATDDAATLDGEIRNDATNKKLKVNLDSAERSIVTEDQTQTLTNKTFDANGTGNSISNIETADLASGVLITDISTASSDTELPSALAVKTALAGQNEASEITYSNATSGLTAVQVQAAIDEVEGRLDTAESNITTSQGTADDHIADATDAHAASAITNTPTGNLAATNVQTALDELQSDVDTRTLETGGSLITPVRSDVKQDTDANLVTYASTAANGQLCFATDTKKMYQVIDGLLKAVGGSGTAFEVTQASHGLTLGSGVYHNGTIYVDAKADAEGTLAYHVVIEVIDANTIVLADFGRVEATAHGFTVGQYYFQSEATAGLPVTTEPSTGFSNPLFYVEDANTLQIKCLRPAPVGQTISLDELSDVSVPSPSTGDILKYTGSQYENGLVEEQVVSIIANEAMDARTPVYILASGQVGKLDVDDDAKMEFIGFTREAATATNPVKVVIGGKLGGFTSLTVGEFVYGDPTTPGTIVQPEPSQANVYLIKLGKAISATEILVNPDLAASAEFNRAVVADISITNNQVTPTNVTALVFDGATYRSVVLRYSIYRVTDSNEKTQTGQLRLTYKTNAASWSISDDFGGDNAGVTFTIDATGQVLYSSTDLTGTSYSSSLKVNTVELFEI